MGSAFATEQGRELSRDDWAAYFEAINRRLEDGAVLDAAVEVTTEKIDGTEAEGLPLDSITWEDGDDQIAIGLGGRDRRFPAVLWHFADHPAEVWVREEGEIPTAIGIESTDGSYTFVRLEPAGG
jgi:hypothetical protein